MDAAERKEYHRQQYLKRQEALNELTFLCVHYPWIASDALHGKHCKYCLFSSNSPADVLSTTGYRDDPIPHEDKLKEHQKHEKHTLNVTNAALKKQGKDSQLKLDGSFKTGDANVYLTITPEDELYARTIRTVHILVSRLLSLNDLEPLLRLQWANGLIVSFDHCGYGDVSEGGLTTWLEAGAHIFQAMKHDQIKNSVMIQLFPNGVPFGWMGDGSTDAQCREKEAVAVRFMGPQGRPITHLHDLPELDLSDSADGRSPDAKCIHACYVKSISKLNVYEGLLFKSDWKEASVGVSFDGASVMMGSQNGVVKLLKDDVKSHPLIGVHGVAHVEQLAMADSFKEVDYYDEWRMSVQEVYVYYNGSGKKRFGLEIVANELDASLLKLKGSHGIRWAAAQARTLEALMKDLHVIVLDLEVTAKGQSGLTLTQLTPSTLSSARPSLKALIQANGSRRQSETLRRVVMALRQTTSLW